MGNALREFLSASSFHGVQFLTSNEGSGHWTEKVFWIACITASWIASVVLIVSSLHEYQHNAISFGVDTAYLTWDTPMPSIATCEYDNQQRIAEITDKLYGDPHDYNLDEIVKELVYFRGLSYYTIQLCGNGKPSKESEVTPNPNCLSGNFNYYTNMVRSRCEETFRACSWNDQPFDCCSYFLPLDTELGRCYAINSRQVKDDGVNSPKRLEMISNKQSGPGKLYLEINNYVNLYALGDGLEVPSLTTLQTDILQISPRIHYKRYVAVREIENEKGVRDVSVVQRNCRFGEEAMEANIDLYPYYSYSVCGVQCRADAQLRLCNCTHHLVPPKLSNKKDSKQDDLAKRPECNLTGMACLNDNYNELAVLKGSWARRTGLVCDCMPSCTEQEIYLVKDEKNPIEQDYAIVEFILERLPSERFRRNVVRGKLDLVVSMGGTAALFLGASLLSFVEVFYHFCIRLTTNFIRRKMKSKKQVSPNGPNIYYNNSMTRIMR